VHHDAGVPVDEREPGDDGDVEAHGRVEDNLTPVGRVYYAFSTLLCTPSSRSQEVGAALGAQAGEARLRETAADAGITQVRRVAETPFNMVLELRP